MGGHDKMMAFARTYMYEPGYNYCNAHMFLREIIPNVHECPHLYTRYEYAVATNKKLTETATTPSTGESHGGQNPTTPSQDPRRNLFAETTSVLAPMTHTGHPQYSTATAGVHHYPVLTTECKGLVGPTADERWSTRYNAQLIEFKAHLEAANRHIDTQVNHDYRLCHIDRAWQNRIHMALFDLPEGTFWHKLPHEEFFQRTFKAFPKAYIRSTHTAWSSPTYTNEAEVFIDMAVYGARGELWTGDWHANRLSILRLTENYGQLILRAAPTTEEHDDNSETQKRLVARMRNILYTYAHSEGGRRNSSGLLAFLGEVDLNIHRRTSSSSSTIVEMKRPTRSDDQHTLASSLPAYLKAFLLTGEHLYTTLILPSQELSLLSNTDRRDVSRGRYGQRPDSSDRHHDRDTSRGRENPRAQSQKESHYGPSAHSEPKSILKNPLPTDRQTETLQLSKKRKDPKPDLPRGASELCTGCGRSHPKPCELGPQGADHPDWNSDPNTPWLDSEFGKTWQAAGKKVLPWGKSKKDSTWTNTRPVPEAHHQGQGQKRAASASRGGERRDTDKKKSKLIDFDIFSRLCTTSTPTLSNKDYLLTCTILNHRGLDRRELSCLVDTGALDTNYVSREVGAWILGEGGQPRKCVVSKVCSCNHDVCVPCLGIVDLDFEFLNELTNQTEKIRLSSTIIDMDFDIIVGRKDIIRHGLILKTYGQIFRDLLPSQLDDTQLRARALHASRLLTISSHGVSATSRRREGSAHTTLVERIKTETRLHPEIERLNVTTTKREVLRKDQLLSGSSGLEGDEELYEDDDDDWDPFKKNQPQKGCIITGSAFVQAEVRKLVDEFKDIFSATLTDQPALIPPMNLKVEEAKWRVNRNRTPHRAVSTLKQKEIQKQVKDMLDAKLIRPSTATHYSQVLLTPKPNNQWRFCVDFRNLNDSTQAESWPLPNIKETLHRIGSSRSKVFGIMDLTKGFYQAPLSETAKIFTAFICFCGLYEWMRVPMGLKGAPSYFQQMLATIVFQGLIHIIMELYIDDIIIHAADEQTFIDRLRQVFLRLRKYKVTVNPAKCRFGMDHIEYVGHIVDPTGLSFSQDKRDKVRDFPLPQTAKHVKSFIGLANYFRDHIPNHSTIMAPIQLMILDYERSRKVIWTEEAKASFETMKNLIADCPKIYFLDEDIVNNPVYLHTDASDYGIGAYLFQIKEDKEYPIQFLSKAFDKVQLRWATGEKEAYAIIYAIRKLKPLLRDIHFTLRTDHKNLTYINDHASPKVNRWKLDLMEYDFDIEHIPGVKNEVADSFSRLLLLKSVRKKAKEYSRLTVPAAHVLAVLAIPENGKLSPFSIPHKFYQKIAKCHNSTVGHFGQELTLKKIHSTFPGPEGRWPQQRAHIKHFILRCPCCQKMSQLRTPILTAKFTTSTYTSMERIYLDSIGPLKEDKYGNKHVVVIVDGFSRWIELYAVPDVTAELAARVALLDWVGRFGTPDQIMTDGGGQFVNQLWEQLTLLMGSEKLESFPSSHEENSLVERANKEVIKHLRNILFDRQIQHTDWSTYLPIVQRIMNAHPLGTTGITPAELLFGNAVSLNDRILPVSQDEVNIPPATLSEVTAEMLAMQAKLIAKHQSLLKKKDEHHLASPYDSKKHVDHFPIGSYVLVEYDSTLKGRGPPHKLMPFKRGPYRVVNNVGTRYTLLDLGTNKHEDVLIHRLHPFHYDEANIDPKTIAARDNEEYTVGQILKHEGDPKHKGTMKFLVHWEGYDDPKEHTWESWKNLRLVDKLHDYLKTHKMGHLIPAECLKTQEPEPSRHQKKRKRSEALRQPQPTTDAKRHNTRSKKTK
jgi:hypothetical protein